jgi:RNA polymerase sigma-70 factor (ECF subfamily)
MELTPLSPDAPDEDILARATQGDEEAFSLLYQRYVNKIYNYIYYRTGSATDAEDLTARVFYRALSHIQSYQPRGVPFSAWLYRIAHNLVANWHRDNSRRQEVSLEDYGNLAHRKDFPESDL